MPHVDAVIFKKKGGKKILSIELSDGEDILSSIKEAMKQHNLNECRVEDINGTMREGVVNYFDRNRYGSMHLANKQLLCASGAFKLNADELWGAMHVSTAEKKPITGTLVSGTAAEGLGIKLSFIALDD